MFDFHKESEFYSRLIQCKESRSSDQDNYKSTLPYLCERLFLVSLPNMISVKASLSKEFHIPPSEIDKMAYWEYELYIKELSRLVKEENDKHEKEQTNQKLPKIQQPKLPEIKIPQYRMPNFK